MNWEDKKVFITGATGFIGSCLTERMIDLGAQVGVFVLDEESVIPDGVKTVFRGNLRELSDIERAIGRFQPEFVFHLASQPLVGTAMISTHDTIMSNSMGSANLLHALKLSKSTRSVIFVSTDKVYGAYDRPVKETDPLLGTDHPYNVSKLCSDLLAQMYAQVYNVPIVIVRSGNVYGYGDKNYDRLIPGVIKSALRGEPFKIRSDGKMIRDYIFVEDVVDAYIHLSELESMLGTLTGKAVNLGATSPASVMDIVDLVLKKMERIDLAPVIRDEAEFEIPMQHLDWSLAHELGWSPETSLDSGLDATIQWHRGLCD